LPFTSKNQQPANNLTQKDNLIENNKLEKNQKIFRSFSNSISPLKNK